MIGVIFIGDLKYCPYLDNYTKYLDKHKIEYEVLYWQRDVIDQAAPSNYIPFKYKSKLNQSFCQKMKGFIRFRHWVKKRIATRKYSKLILLSTLSGMIIPDVLKDYKDNYIFDIRDYSYESFYLFKKLESKLIEQSYFTAISSPKFKDFLPKSNKYILNHNINLSAEPNHKFEKVNKKRLNFVWAGAIRYLEHQKKILKQLGNDNRFNIIYHGVGSDYEALRNYSIQSNIQNVTFTGVYHNKDKEKLLANADILNNSYDNEEQQLKTKFAISNTFYDGITLKIPQLVETGSYKEILVNQYQIGKALDVNKDSFASELFEYYHSIDTNQFNKNANQLYTKYAKEQEKYYSKIEEFITM